MSNVKTVFALWGVLILAFAIAGEFGIGHFRLYYGDDSRGCAKMEAKLAKDQP